MQDYAIDIQHLDKSFTLFRHTTGIKGMVLHLPKYIKDRTSPRTKQVFKDFSLQVPAGETLGIAGANGCGKTTLLSLIGKVIKPDRGTVKTRGRISMMLALGAGFANELSGRENIILNGVLQGMPRRKMNELLEEIIDVTEISGEFIDAPIYTYSSGMRARLGFGVAIMTDPDILLVDEVLSVGDSAFQQKCTEMIRAKQKKGMTIVLVSHNRSQLLDFCTSLIYMQGGQVLLSGSPESVMAEINNRKLVF